MTTLAMPGANASRRGGSAVLANRILNVVLFVTVLTSGLAFIEPSPHDVYDLRAAAGLRDGSRSLRSETRAPVLFAGPLGDRVRDVASERRRRRKSHPIFRYLALSRHRRRSCSPVCSATVIWSGFRCCAAPISWQLSTRHGGLSGVFSSGPALRRFPALQSAERHIQRPQRLRPVPDLSTAAAHDRVLDARCHADGARDRGIPVGRLILVLFTWRRSISDCRR